MKKQEIENSLKLLGEYKGYMMSGAEPFAYQNAMWASGFEYFLEWVKTNKSRQIKKNVSMRSPKRLVKKERRPIGH